MLCDCHDLSCPRLWERPISGIAAHVVALSRTPTAGRLQQSSYCFFVVVFSLLPRNKLSFFPDFSRKAGHGRDVVE